MQAIIVRETCLGFLKTAKQNYKVGLQAGKTRDEALRHGISAAREGLLFAGLCEVDFGEGVTMVPVDFDGTP